MSLGPEGPHLAEIWVRSFAHLSLGHFSHIPSPLTPPPQLPEKTKGSEGNMKSELQGDSDSCGSEKRLAMAEGQRFPVADQHSSAVSGTRMSSRDHHVA